MHVTRLCVACTNCAATAAWSPLTVIRILLQKVIAVADLQQNQSALLDCYFPVSGLHDSMTFIMCQCCAPVSTTLAKAHVFLMASCAMPLSCTNFFHSKASAAAILII